MRNAIQKETTEVLENVYFSPGLHLHIVQSYLVWHVNHCKIKYAKKRRNVSFCSEFPVIKVRMCFEKQKTNTLQDTQYEAENTAVFHFMPNLCLFPC